MNDEDLWHQVWLVGVMVGSLIGFASGVVFTVLLAELF